MSTKLAIQLDEANMVLQPFATGVDVHETNGPIQTCRIHWAACNIGGAGEGKPTIYRRARGLMRRHDRA